MSGEQQQDMPRRVGSGMYAVMWIVILLLLTYGFNSWLDSQRNPNAEPDGVHLAGGGSEVVLQRNRYGHYVADGRINGMRVTFMLDTGASDVSIPGAVADRLRLQRGAAGRYQTANGTITAYKTRLDSVELGNILVRDVDASINPHMRGDEILLGMSFLKQLEFTQRGDTLTLRQF